MRKDRQLRSTQAHLSLHGTWDGNPFICIIVFLSGLKAGDVLVATGAEDSTVRLWDLRNKSNEEALSWTVTSCLCRCFDGEPVASVVFSPDAGDRLYCSAGGKASL